MGQLTKIIAIAAFVAASSIAQAAPQATIKSRFSGQVSPNNTGCEFPDDAVSVLVTDNGRTLVEERLCSTFGRGKAETFITHSGKTFVLVEQDTGRGTNATTTSLAIYSLDTDALDEKLEIPISWPTGPNGHFTYSYTTAEDQAGGLEVALKGRGAGQGDECCEPAEKSQTVHIDP